MADPGGLKNYESYGSDPQHWFDIPSLTSGASRRRNRREILAAAAAVPFLFIRTERCVDRVVHAEEVISG